MVLRALLVEDSNEVQLTLAPPTEELNCTVKLRTTPVKSLGKPTALNSVAVTATPVQRSTLLLAFGARAIPMLRLRFSALKPVALLVTSAPLVPTVSRDPPTPMNNWTPVNSMRTKSTALVAPPIKAEVEDFSNVKLPSAST